MYLTNQYKYLIIINIKIWKGDKMPLQRKSNETIYQGREAYVKIDAKALHETGEVKIIGEPIEAEQVVKKVPRNGFEITYLAYFCDLFDKLGGKKYVVFKYIIEHKNADNQLIITNRELSQKCNVGINTVTDTLKLLKDAGLISTRTGAIMLFPKLSMRGTDRKEAYLMQKFETFDNKEEKEV